MDFSSLTAEQYDQVMQLLQKHSQTKEGEVSELLAVAEPFVESMDSKVKPAFLALCDMNCSHLTVGFCIALALVAYVDLNNEVPKKDKKTNVQ